jgi:predicted transcriptional regulator
MYSLQTRENIVSTSAAVSTDLVALASEVVAAFVASNSLPSAELPGLIVSVHAALARLAAGMSVAELPAPAAPTPAVSVRQSISPDYLICLDDGRKFKSLRRHLAILGMTPEQYRAKWKLPSDYPMVAPNYAATRSALAKSIGLGQLRRKETAPKVEPVVSSKPKRGRPRKTKA